MALTEQQINDLKARYSTPTKATGAARPVEDVATRMARIKASVPTQAPEEGFFSKAGSFLKEATMGNTLRFGKTAGEALAAPENADKYAQVMESHSQIQDDLSKKIAENKKAGKDTSRLEATLNQHIASTPRIEDFTGEVINKTTGQVLGEAAGTVLEATTGGILSGFGKGTGILSNVARTAKKAEKAKLAYDALSFGGKAAKIGMDTAKLAATTVPFAYAYDVSSGLQGMRGEERTGGAAFIPGMSTAIGTAIPLTVGGVRLAKAGVVSAAKEMIPRLSANLGAAPEGAYRQAQKGGVSEFMGARYSGKGAETVESVFDAARQSGKNLKSMNSREWKSTVDAITKEFTGRRIGLPQKETSTLQKIAEKFGFEDRLPKNLGNMSAKETIDLITEINDIGVVKYADDPLTKNLKVALGDIKKVLKGKAINEFGGAGGTFETFYKTQSAQRNVLSNIEAIVGNLATDPNPVSRVTLQNRLQKIFDADKTAYFNAIKSLDDVTGSRLLDKVAAAQLSPILPKGLKGGPSGIIGVASDLLQITTIPLSSPRMSNWLLSKASGYDSVVINNIMKSSPVVRQAIYKLVNEKHMTLNEAIDDVWTKIQKTPNKQGGFVGIGAMGDDISGGANKMLNKTRIADLEANIKAFQKLKQTPEVIADIAKKKQELTMLKYGINNSKDLYDTTKAFGANTRNVTKEVKEVAKNLEKESTFEVKGFNAANPIDTATEVIEGHIKKMKDMLADPDLASMAKGQEKEMLAGLKVDIIDGLKASGFTDEANKMAEKLKNVNSLDEILKINFNEGTIPEIVTESIKQAKASGQSFDEWVKGQGDEIVY
jgi:hypothetical protein